MRFLCAILVVLAGVMGARAEWYIEKEVGGLTGRTIAVLGYDDFDNALVMRCGDVPSKMSVSYVFADVSITEMAARELNRGGVYLKWRVDEGAVDGRRGELLLSGEFTVLVVELGLSVVEEMLGAQEKIAVGLQRSDNEVFHERTYSIQDGGPFAEMRVVCLGD